MHNLKIMAYGSSFICVCTCGVGKETDRKTGRSRERKDSNINMDANRFLRVFFIILNFMYEAEHIHVNARAYGDWKRPWRCMVSHLLWVMGTESGSSAGAVHSLSHQATSPALYKLTSNAQLSLTSHPFMAFHSDSDALSTCFI